MNKLATDESLVSGITGEHFQPSVPPTHDAEIETNNVGDRDTSDIRRFKSIFRLAGVATAALGLTVGGFSYASHRDNAKAALFDRESNAAKLPRGNTGAIGETIHPKFSANLQSQAEFDVSRVPQPVAHRFALNNAPIQSGQIREYIFKSKLLTLTTDYRTYCKTFPVAGIGENATVTALTDTEDSLDNYLEDTMTITLRPNSVELCSNTNDALDDDPRIVFEITDNAPVNRTLIELK